MRRRRRRKKEEEEEERRRGKRRRKIDNEETESTRRNNEKRESRHFAERERDLTFGGTQNKNMHQFISNAFDSHHLDIAGAIPARVA